MQDKNRWVIYARRVGHKKAHPCAPSRGLYNCPLTDLERYSTRQEALDVCALLSRLIPGTSFFVCYIHPDGRRS